MIEIFSMWIYYVENYMPMKIHTYAYYRLRAITCLFNFMALWLDEFIENTVGTILFWGSYGNI